MNIKEVKDLIHEVLGSDITEFELEHTGTKVKLKRGYSPDSGALRPAAAQEFHTLAPAPAPAATGPAQATAGEEADEAGLHFITSPLVGTFYRAPSPGADAYVRVGDHVHEGSILCIVEAMKLMNEVPSDVEGEVVRIYVENGTPVEFGQKLFAIRPIQG